MIEDKFKFHLLFMSRRRYYLVQTIGIIDTNDRLNDPLMYTSEFQIQSKVHKLIQKTGADPKIPVKRHANRIRT